MHLWSILCCCCKEDTEKYEHMKEDTSGVVKKELSVKKPSFPRIVIQEPTPLTLRRDSQIVIVKQPKQQTPVIEGAIEIEADEEYEEQIDFTDAGAAMRMQEEKIAEEKESSKKASLQRKKSIPLLDDEMQNIKVKADVTVEVTESTSQDSFKSSSSVQPPSSSSSQVQTSATLKTQSPQERKVSEVSTSSNWSWPTDTENDKFEEESKKPQKTTTGLAVQDDKKSSRRISGLPPAQVSDPLAKKVKDFTVIPHPGK